ncbi:Transcriptional regulator, contains XRE-family HTH domain [Anaerovirgula multivorans]|uniref:Transcriptional regulator, contains XRE-family HTH domain n=1 Tax=Anaerovirgula multivorans TaxID=312168 RepID=A0A239GUQ0_9FIRM|nr:helix-turn-helix transcriptional regulator [Anaerovirgula multivorans]SNS72701.1 Transcriptional regulator, contains XRE-family HTH domain [Anaerovirgula multivorans]
MTLGERIQICRKSKSLSQEEMASVLGVSRQAISKWECNASIPDIDKIIALSNFFNVSTDYLLKDEYANENEVLSTETKKRSGNIPIAISTAIIAIGLIIALAMANDGTLFFYWQFSSAALGIGIQIIGICVFEVLYFSKLFEMKRQYLFWSINIWLLSVMPIILSSGVLSKLLNRLEVLHYSFSIVLFYFIFNGVVTFAFLTLSKRWNNARKSKYL